MYEVAKLLVSVSMALAIVHATFVRAHISMDVLGGFTGRRDGVLSIAAMFTMTVLASMAVYLFNFAASKVRYGETSFLLGIPLAPVWYGIASLFVLAFLAQLFVL